MFHEIESAKEFNVTDSNLTFEEIYKKPYIPQEFIKEIKQANLLLIPYEKFRDFNFPVFPEETSKFYDFVKEEVKFTEAIPEICISDDDYKELELHSDVINFPEIFTTLIVFPIIVNVVSAYLTEKMRVRKTNIKANINITVEVSNKSKKIHYEGDADKFEEAMRIVNKQLLKK